VKFAFFGDGLWARRSLERLVADGHEPAVVVLRSSTGDTELAAAARALGIDTVAPSLVNSAETLEQLAGTGAELWVSMAYNQIFRREALALPRLGCINCHAGKLPLYRGANVLNWVLINGETELGLTIHYVDEGIDTGDIILQRTLPIGWETTYGELLEQATLAFPDLVSDAVGRIAAGTAERRPQGAIGTYFGRRRPGDEWLDWTDSSAAVYNKVRAITRPGPGARTRLGDQTVIVWSSSYDPSWPEYVATCGEVVGRSAGQGVIVKSGNSTVLVREVQVGDAAPRIADFPIGTRFSAAT
jgi:methionyl-tRNA formyltransferase